MIHYITEIKNVEMFTITLLFNTGETLTVDLHKKITDWSRTPGSAFRYLLDANNFSQVKLNEDFGTIYWDNGIDLCPDVLFDLGMQYQNDSTYANTKSTTSYKTHDEMKADVQIVREKKK